MLARRIMRAERTSQGIVTPPSTGIEALINRVVGITADSGTVKLKTRTSGTGLGGTVRIKVGTDSAVTLGIAYSDPVTPNSQGDAIHTLPSLARGQTYYYRVLMNSTIDTASIVGKIRVAPTVASSFAFCFASCCNATDSSVFSTIINRNDPIFIHTGDFWYADDTGATIANFRTRMNNQLNGANQGNLYATTALSYTPSDHDAGMKNNSIGTLDPAALAVFNQAYRENFPLPLVQPTSGVYHTFVYGRIRFIVMDARTFKSNPAATDNSSKTMLGSIQKQWVKDTITAATEPVLIMVSDVPWSGATTAGEDDWSGYNTERIELGDYINASGKKAVFLGGDMHAVGHSSGATYGRGIPDYQAAPLSQSASVKGAPWDAVYPASGTAAISQYGRVVVTDTGSSTISLAFTGYSSTNTVRVSRTDTFSV